MNTSLKTTLTNFAVNRALGYIENNPEENIPKLMALVDRSLPADSYGSARKSATSSRRRTTGISLY